MRIGDSYKPPQIIDVNKYASPAEPQPMVALAEDSLEISADSRQKATEDKNGQTDITSLLEQLENARKQGEAMGEEMQSRIKCLRIAMRIMAGDKVPMEDHRYLAEKDSALYARAIMMKMENKHPKKHERISEDEEAADNEASSTATGSEAAPAAEISAEAAPPAGDGGGEAPSGEGGGDSGGDA